MLFKIIFLIICCNSVLLKAKEYCRSKIRLVDSDRNDLYDLIDVNLREELILQCRYCQENDDKQAKIWYKIDTLGSSQAHEVQLNFHNNFTSNRVRVNEEHDLIIEQIKESDRGLYYCQRLEGATVGEKFNFLVDLTNPLISEESGNLSHWYSYEQAYFPPINSYLKLSQDEDFQKFRSLVDAEVVTIWGNWGNCEVCNRPQDDGVRRRIGQCRLKLSSNFTNDTEGLGEDEIFLVSAYAISCRSLLLERFAPNVANETKSIPDFVQIQHCEGVCNPGSEGDNKGWKTGKKKKYNKYKYRKTLILDESSHTSFICPESSLENKVIWRRNGKIIEVSDTKDFRMYVDSFNTLYLINVNENQDGNYTCEVDGVKMQHIKIFINSKTKIFTAELARYLGYLAFILSLTIFCYCAGLIIACSRKRKFKGYRQLRDEHPDEFDDSGSDTTSV